VSFLGVTELVDPATGARVGDAPGSTMIPGAARMALIAGKAKPAYRPAEAAPHPGGGWDLTIRLSKNDPGFRAIPRAPIVALVTTNMVIMVPVRESSNALYGIFARETAH
jgi:hypothetical protein